MGPRGDHVAIPGHRRGVWLRSLFLLKGMGREPGGVRLRLRLDEAAVRPQPGEVAVWPGRRGRCHG